LCFESHRCLPSADNGANTWSYRCYNGALYGAGGTGSKERIHPGDTVRWRQLLGVAWH